MNKFFSLVLALVASLGIAMAGTVYDFSSAIPAGWSVNPAPNGFEETGDARGMQMTASTTITLPGVQNVGSVVINGSSNIADYTVQVKVGSTSFGTQTIDKANDQTWTFSGTVSSGELKIIVTRGSKKSLYIKTVTIDGTADTPQTPGDDTQLDSTYVYAEPTMVVNTDSVGSNREYSFVSNNILVHTTTGARVSQYFGVNAGNSITFTATQPMKAIVVNGFIKKGFEAEASSGEIAYADADEDNVEADQVLAVTDINATSLTIDCEKQMRCYSVAVYFQANPDSLDIEPGGEDYEYSFEWEPTEKKTLSVTFDSIEVTPMTESLGYACTGLYLMSDDYEMELSVFVDTDSLTILPAGTYPIDNSYTDNTVMASPGGNDEYDFPSYLITDFEQDAASGEWYYNTVYYLASGTLKVTRLEQGVLLAVDATSHFGSIIHATYTLGEGEPVEDAVQNTWTTPRATKLLRDGRLIIEHNGTKYNAAGIKL